MRTFTLGHGIDRRVVDIEVLGVRVLVTDTKPDGRVKQRQKTFRTKAQSRKAAERVAREMISRGYVEERGARRPKAAARTPASARPAPSGELDGSLLFEDGEPPAPAPLPPRSAGPPALDDPDDEPVADEVPARSPRKKSGRRKKKRKKSASGDGLDKRVMFATCALGFLLAFGFVFILYDVFLKPPSIVGTWAGSRTEHEISRFIRHTTYGLILDEHGAAARSIEEHIATGTYTVQGDRLKLTFKDDDGGAFHEEYRIELGSVTLDMYDPRSGKKIVQMIRQSAPPRIAGSGGAPKGAAPPQDVAAAKADPAADAKLASVGFSPKDGAFRLRHPPGWSVETGSRPDNTYSWARFTKGSGKIQVYADVTGSLMSGSDLGRNHEEGSEFAPVHRAHELYKKTISEQYSGYQESAPAVFKGSMLGEGRVATFTASDGGFFGGKVRGYRVTLLTNNRRVTLLCECPEKEFEALRPTFLAVCRSVDN